MDATNAYNNAYNWGSNLMDFQKETTDKEKEKTSLLDGLGNKLGLTDQFDALNNIGDEKLLSPNSAEDYLKDIAGDTGAISDSMDLTEEDLDYLRRIADMEWKKEFTTANITVDMSNYNTINGESDLDGIVTQLSDKLREELNVVANGVYA